MFGQGLFQSKKRALLDAVSRSQAIIEFDLNGKIIDANENFLETMGYNLDELRGKSHSIFLDGSESSSASYRAFWDELRKGLAMTGEFRRLAKGGREVWIQASYNPVFGSGGKPVGVVKFAADVTKAKLRAISDSTQITSIASSQAVIHFDLDGTITAANPIFLEMMGYKQGEIVGQNHRICVTPKYAASSEYAEFWGKLRRGEPQTAEYKRLGKNGREVWILATYTPIMGLNGKPTEIVKFARNVTDLKLMHADYEGQITAINKSQAVIHFTMDGEILEANQNFLDSLGYTSKEVIGNKHSMFIDPAQVSSPEYTEFWNKLSRGEFHSAVYKRIGKGGRIVWISATYNPILDLNGKPWKVVKYATDITGRMEARAQAIGFADQTLSNVQSVAAAVEQMSVSAAQISETMMRSRDAVSTIKQQTSNADLSTKRLQNAASSMDRVMQMIRSIASQITMLSLNATIESARAGDAGKGFAVVANEVKQLANQTTAATQQVAKEITAMQTVSSEVAESLGEISASVVSLLQFVTAASGAVEEQNAATREISSNIQATSVDVAGISRSLNEDVQVAA